jgi:hypothetical protein
VPRLLAAAALAAAASVPASGASPRFDPPTLAIGPETDGPALALAAPSAARVAVLGPVALELYRWPRGAPAVRLDRAALPEPLDVVRRPGGLLAVEGEGLVWALSSRLLNAVRFEVLDQRLGAARVERASLPWPGAAQGLRFRAGTSWIEGSVDGLGTGPFTAVAAGAAVAEDARLRIAAPDGPRLSGLRLGTCLTALADGVWAASAPSRPGEAESILLIGRGEPEPVLLDTLGVPGRVEALGTDGADARARLLFAVEGSPGRSRLGTVEVRLQ